MEPILNKPTLSPEEARALLFKLVAAEEFERFRAGVPAADRDGDLVDAYRRLLARDDPKVRSDGAKKWCEWEDAVLSLEVVLDVSSGSPDASSA